MNETNRRQTTTGIWLAMSDCSPTLILDVEGTDSRERGEEAAVSFFLSFSLHCIF
jgi:hypothetical protein